MPVCKFRRCLEDATELAAWPTAGPDKWTDDEPPEPQPVWCMAHRAVLDAISRELESSRPPKTSKLTPAAPVVTRFVQPRNPPKETRSRIPKAQRAQSVRAFLMDQGGYVKRGEIAEHLGVREGGGLTRILGYAIEQGLIERHPEGEKRGYRAV